MLIDNELQQLDGDLHRLKQAVRAILGTVHQVRGLVIEANGPNFDRGYLSIKSGGQASVLLKL